MKNACRPCYLILIVGVMISLSGVARAGDGLFGYMGIRADSIQAIPKWVEALQRIKADEPKLVDCLRSKKACENRNMRLWRKLVRNSARLTPMEQLTAVDEFFNDYRYISDMRHWGVTDYWETPVEFIDDSGDCEDYAIAKYYTLRAMGWDDSRLRLVVLYDTVRNTPHAVLSARVETQGEKGSDGKATSLEMILDNLTTEPLSDKYMMQYIPYYAVNETTRWVFVKPLTPDADGLDVTAVRR